MALNFTIEETHETEKHKEWRRLNSEKYNETHNRQRDIRRKEMREANKPKPLRSNNSSGYSNIFWEASRERWTVRITVNGKKKRLGRYRELSDAVNALRNQGEVISDAT